MATPDDNVIREWMKKLVKEVDLETMTTKQFIAKLGDSMGGVELSSKKKFIKDALTEILDDMDDNDDEEEESDEESSSEEEEEEEEKPKAKKKKGGGGGGRASGLTAVKEISDDLAAFLGTGKMVARTEVVKALWAYIRENNLQNPEDKREILLDDKLKSLFHCDRFTMFTMNKYIGSHIHPYPPVDLTTNKTVPKKRKQSKDKGGKGKKGKNGRSPGTQAPYRLSPEMARVCGKDILPRPQVTQALWAYIRKHNLQNPEDKRQILCDDNLRAIMGGESTVTMFTMNKYISPHMVEKLDKSAYVHEEAPKEEASESESEEESESESEGESDEDSDSDSDSD